MIRWLPDYRLFFKVSDTISLQPSTFLRIDKCSDFGLLHPLGIPRTEMTTPFPDTYTDKGHPSVPYIRSRFFHELSWLQWYCIHIQHSRVFRITNARTCRWRLRRFPISDGRIFSGRLFKRIFAQTKLRSENQMCNVWPMFNHDFLTFSVHL